MSGEEKIRNMEWIGTFFIWYSIFYMFLSGITTCIVIIDYPSVRIGLLLVGIVVYLTLIVSIVFFVLSKNEKNNIWIHKISGYIAFSYAGIGVLFFRFIYIELGTLIWHFEIISYIFFLVSLVILFGNLICSLFLAAIGIDCGNKTQIIHVKISSTLGFTFSLLSPLFLLFIFR